MNFNIDIHCHPSTKPYMSNLSKKKDPFIHFNHHIESSIMKLIKGLLEKNSEVLMASQSNFDNLFLGGHRVVIASITPMEKAFLVANKNRSAIPILMKALIESFIVDHNGIPDTIKPKLPNSLMGFSTPCIEFVRDTEANCFKDALTPEYEYLKKFNNQVSAAHGYTLKFVKNFREIEEGISSGEKAIYVVLSIEGAHAFQNTVPGILDIKAGQGRIFEPGVMNAVQDGPGIAQNIAAIKKNWEFVPLFVTMMHHFWNGMGGHARSLNKIIGEMLNQTEGINQGLTGTGRMVIRELLSETNGPRILIDIKHMSIASRREYYQILDTDPLFKNKNIPIICSHTGMASGIDTLNELAQVNDKAEETNNKNYFHKAQINLCGEDIRRIAKSNGLIGLQLDEKRIAGAGFVETRLRGAINLNDQMNACAEVVMSNVFMVVKAVNSIKGWDLCCIGSDFDGLINHLDPFPDSGRISILRDEVVHYLKNLHDVKEPHTGNMIFSIAEMQQLMFGLSPEEITEKIFSGNAMNFLRANFNR